MSVTLISDVTAANNSSGGTSNPINTTGANLIVVAASRYQTNSNTISVSDSNGNTWTPGTLYGSSNNQQVQFFYCVSPTVGPGHTFTISSPGCYPSAVIAAFSGILTPSPLDAVNGTSSTAGSTTSVQTGSITPNFNGELIVSIWGGDTSFSSLAVDSGLNIINQNPWSNNNYVGGAIAYVIQATAAMINPTWSWAGNVDAAAAIVSFQAAGGATIAFIGATNIAAFGLPRSTYETSIATRVNVQAKESANYKASSKLGAVDKLVAFARSNYAVGVNAAARNFIAVRSMASNAAKVQSAATAKVTNVLRGAYKTIVSLAGHSSSSAKDSAAGSYTSALSGKDTMVIFAKALAHGSVSISGRMLSTVTGRLVAVSVRNLVAIATITMQALALPQSRTNLNSKANSQVKIPANTKFSALQQAHTQISAFAGAAYKTASRISASTSTTLQALGASSNKVSVSGNQKIALMLQANATRQFFLAATASIAATARLALPQAAAAIYGSTLVALFGRLFGGKNVQILFDPDYTFFPIASWFYYSMVPGGGFYTNIYNAASQANPTYIMGAVYFEDEP